MWPPAAPMQGMCRCESMLSLQDCSPFRKSADLSSQLCGNLCSATGVLHGQLSGRMFSIRHVRSNSGERVSVGPSVSSLGLNVVAWAVRSHVPPSIFDVWGSMCSAPKAVYNGCEIVWGGGTIALLTHRPPSIPRVMMPPTERFGIWCRASGCQN